MVLESVVPYIPDLASSLASALSGRGFLSCSCELVSSPYKLGEKPVSNCTQGLSAYALSFLSRFLLTWSVSYFNQLAFNILFFFCLCRKSLLFSNPRMKSHTGILILSGPSGCKSCAVPAALAVTALSSTRAISQRQGPAWWTKNWNSTLYPVQRLVSRKPYCLARVFLDLSPATC